MLKTSPFSGKSVNPIVILAMVEFWERFNKYALRAFLVLYLISPTLAHGGSGLEWSISRSLHIYGIAIFSAYFFPIIGGAIGDKTLGAFNATLIGSISITVGQIIISQAYHSANSTLLVSIGLLLFAIGNGLFKPNIARLVGEVSQKRSLNCQNSYSLFFIITNFGGVISGLSLGIIVTHLNQNYAAAFIIAACGMTFGSLILLFFKYHLISNIKPKNLNRRFKRLKRTTNSSQTDNPLIYILVIGIFTVLFWVGYQQMSGSLNIVLDRLTDRRLGNLIIPVAWFQSITPLFNVILSLLFKRHLIGTRTDVFSLPKRVFISTLIAGFVFLVISFVLMNVIKNHSHVIMLVIFISYIGFSIGEIILSPTCLSSISILIPAERTSFVMGVWFLFYGVASYLSGLIGKLINPHHNIDISNVELLTNIDHTYLLLSLIILLGSLCLLGVRRKLILLLSK